MTIKDLEAKIQWEDAEYGSYEGCLNMASHILGNDFRVSFNITDNGSGPQLSPAALEVFSYFINVGEPMKKAVSSGLFDHFMQHADDMEPPTELLENETETEANIRHFGIKNPEDAIKAAKLSWVHVSDDAGTTPGVEIDFNVPWDDEHGAKFFIYDEAEIESNH